MKRFLILIIALVLTGCAAPYQVRELTNEFNKSTDARVFSMMGNNTYIGGIKDDALDGFVMRDPKTGKTIGTGFYLTIVSSNQYDLNATWVNIRKGNPIVFLADGQRIESHADFGKIDHQMISIGSSYHTDFYDYAAYDITPEQFKKIAFAKSLKFEVTGNNRIVTYPSGQQKFLESFQANLQKFYNEEIKGR